MNTLIGELPSIKISCSQSGSYEAMSQSNLPTINTTQHIDNNI